MAKVDAAEISVQVNTELAAYAASLRVSIEQFQAHAESVAHTCTCGMALDLAEPIPDRVAHIMARLASNALEE